MGASQSISHRHIFILSAGAVYTYEMSVSLSITPRRNGRNLLRFICILNDGHARMVTGTVNPVTSLGGRQNADHSTVGRGFPQRSSAIIANNNSGVSLSPELEHSYQNDHGIDRFNRAASDTS